MKTGFVQWGGKLLLLGLCLSSCSDDIAEDVYDRTKTPPSEKTSSLTVMLIDGQNRENLVLGALQESLFDESGNARTVAEADFLLNGVFSGGTVRFDDLMDYYGTTLYFNVFSTTEDGLDLLTHHGNELRYQVVAGDIEKSIDLSAAVPDAVHKTVVTVTVASEYAGKAVYVTDEERSSLLKERVAAGEEVSSDLYIWNAEAGEEPLSFTINSPASAGKYYAYLAAPEEGIAYLVREAEIGYETETASFSFEKEQPKVINVTATYLEGTEEPYAETPLHNKEVYLIAADRWQEVRDHVDDDKGNPEPGTFVQRETLMNGSASFSVFCTEGSQEYVVYVPKWNTDYYDSYEFREVTVDALTQDYAVDIRALFTPPGSGGDVGITKTVDFTVKVDAYPEEVLPNYILSQPNIFILTDSQYYNQFYYYLFENRALPEEVVWYKSEDISGSLPINVTLSDVEINTANEIVVMLPGYSMNFATYMGPAPLVKRIRGSEITGNTCELTLEEIEYIN